MTRIYLDHSATTPVHPLVADAMFPYFTQIFGNASSSHGYGREADNALDESRRTIARVLNCEPDEVIFTSGGSESDNLAVRGAAWDAKARGAGNHLVTTAIEHGAIGATVAQLAALHGFERTVLPVDRAGRVSVADFERACRPGTAFASVMYANNEVGTVQPIAALATIARERGIVFHTDAVQAAGQLPLDVQALGVDLLSLSAHKFYGPKGVGALYVRRGTNLVTAQTGGSQEHGLRAGTYNTPLIVGMAKALELAYRERDSRTEHYRALRDRLIDGILATIPQARLTGHPTNRLAAHASFVFEGLSAGFLLDLLDARGIAASAASACKAGKAEPSGVLLALGYAPEVALTSLRLTVGLHTTFEEIDTTIDALADIVPKLARFNVAARMPQLPAEVAIAG